MARKIRIIGSSLCVMVFIAAIIAICVVGGNSVARIKNVVVSKTNDTSVALEWSGAEDVDGYIVFKKSANDKDYTKGAVVNDPATTKTVVAKLNPYTEYSFYVVAFKGAGDDEIIGKKKSAVTTVTLPQTPVVKVDSTNKGELNITWKEIKNSAGYELYYKGGSDEKTEVIEDKLDAKRLLKDKTADTKYTVKVRSFVYKSKEKIYSPWSKPQSVVISNFQIQSSTIDPSKPMVALSFDDGPDYKSSSKRILDVLEKYNAKASFFMLGRNAMGNSDNLKRKVELGMEIGNHTYDHEHYGKNVTANDILKASQAIENACGVYPTAFRSPGGMTNEVIRNECKSEGMPLYYWSLDTKDWKYRDGNKVYNTVMNNVEDGDIILMHEIYSSTADAVEKMVPALIAKGYQLVTCSDLIKYKTGSAPVAGTQYVDADTINNSTN